MNKNHPLYIARLAAMASAHESASPERRELEALAARDRFISNSRRKARARRRKGGWRSIIHSGKRFSDGRRHDDSDFSCSGSILVCLSISSIFWCTLGFVVWAFN